MKDMYLLFDIGGTKMRLAISRDGKTFEEPRIIETPQDFGEGIKNFRVCAEDLCNGEKITAVAGGIAGLLDARGEQLLGSSNISGWIKKPLKKEIEKAVGGPVYIGNDADLVGLGEALDGAGTGEEIVVYVTVSTGLGGTRIVNGKIDAFRHGLEPGKQVIDASGGFCPDCKSGGYLEGYVSGSALERRFGKKAYEITDKRIWDEQAKWLSYGLYNMILHWSPDVMILGGSMMTKSPGIELVEVKRYLTERFSERSIPIPKLVKAKLEDVGGLHGALAFIHNKQNES